MSVRLNLLGTPGILFDDSARQGLPLGKPLALLVYLVDHGPATRDHLAEVLWPASDRSKGRASVRQALWLLRQRIGDEVFASEEPVRISPGFLTTDVDGLLKLLRANPSAAAVKPRIAYPLEGLTVADAPIWRNWAEDFRGRVSHRIGSELLSLAAAAEASGSITDAEEFLKLASEIEPFRGETRLRFIEHLLSRGDIDQAEQALADTRRLNDQDLNQALGYLDQRIREIRRSRFSYVEPGVQTDYVGRSRETSLLMAAYRDALAGRGQVALITGPAGIGKTRLATEVSSMAAAEGAAVVRVKAHDTERVLRFSVLAEFARALLALPGAAGITTASDDALRTFLPSLQRSGANGGPAPGTKPSLPATYTDRHPDPGTGRTGPIHHVALADAFLDLIDAVSTENPLVMVLDDLHWCDEASRAVVTRTARAMAGTHTCWLMTSRRSRDPGLARTLNAIEGVHGARTMDLSPLHQEDIEELLGLMVTFDRPTDLQAMAEELHDTSGGNPLFLVEILRGLRRQGVLDPTDDGKWTLIIPSEGLKLDLPTSLRSTLLSRLRHLDQECLGVAGRLASRGVPSRPEALGGPDVWPCVQVLLDAGLVAAHEQEGRIDFVHDEIRSAVRGLTRPRRWRKVSAAGAAAVLVVAATIGLKGTEAEARTATADPFGGGTIVLTHAGERLAYRFRGEPPTAVPVLPPGRGIPTWAKPYRRADGVLFWFGASNDVGRAPDLVRYEESGDTRVLFSGPGDENPQSLSPDGARLLYTSDDPDRAGYQTDLWEIDLDGTQPRRVLPAHQVLNAMWSPTGEHVAVRKIGTPDTLEILTPDFDRVHRTLMDRVEAFTWCGSEALLLVSEAILSSPRLHLLSPSGELQDIPVPSKLAGRQVACSPDGSQIILEVVTDGTANLMRLDRGSGDLFPTAIPWGNAFFWLPDTLPVIPTEVRLPKDTIRLAWGETRPLPLDVQLSNGEQTTLGAEDREASSIRWRSADEGVAFISEAGTLYANGVGETTITVGVSGSARDTALVIVDGTESSEALFLDSLNSPWEPRWFGLGTPQPTLVSREGETNLHVRGDGSITDGIVSRESFQSSTGYTLEWEMKLPLTRRDRQSVSICLARAFPPSTGDSTNWTLWNPDGSICFAYPHGYLARFRPDVASLSSGVSPLLFTTTPGLPSDDWVHVALQIRPDGTPAILLNRRLAIEGEARLLRVSEPGWRIVVTGHSVDTELLVRSLVLWPSARFR